MHTTNAFFKEYENRRFLEIVCFFDVFFYCRIHDGTDDSSLNQRFFYCKIMTGQMILP